MKPTALVLLPLLLLGLLCTAVAQPHVLDEDDAQSLFSEFINKFAKKYESTSEFVKRFRVFRENLERMAFINSEVKDDRLARLGINKFSDLTIDEFRAQYLLPRRRVPSFSEERYASPIAHTMDLPATFDWRDHGAVTPVRDQGTVGTCWAFSTVENVESQWFLAGNNLTVLSVEQVVDCDYTEDPHNINSDCGVFGGWPYLAYQYIMRTGGLTSEATYPYCCGTGDCFPCQAQGYNKTRCGPPVPSCDPKQNKCQYVQDLIAQRDQRFSTQSNQADYGYVATIKDWTAVAKNETEIAAQLVSRGPLSILIDASWLSYYKSGIWPPNSSTCSQTDTDHAVLLVGYGADYWIVRNSWGKDWGMDGYFYLQKGSNACAINTGVTSSIA